MIDLNNSYEIILTENQIKDKVSELGKQITLDYKDKDLAVIGILKGSVLFFADLIRAIELGITVDFMKVSSYNGQMSSSGRINVISDCSIELEGKDILLVEDIIDTGATSGYLIEKLKSKNTRSVKICALLNKKNAEAEGRRIKIDYYIGFDVPDKFLIGYGLDYKEKYRNLPYIAALIN